jgi:hypothetical protein
MRFGQQIASKTTTCDENSVLRRSRVMTKRAVFATCLLALMVAVAPASAALVIDFEQGPVTGGTLTYSGSTAQGVNIPVDVLKVTNGATTTFFDLFGAGPSSPGETNGSALVNFNTATGAFTITGGVCVAGNNTCNGGAGTLVASTNLVTGAPPVHIVTMSNTVLDLQQPDTKAASLLTALGIPLNTSFNLMDAVFNNLQLIAPNTFTVGSVDIANVGVPEPASILLMGTVLLGVSQLIRRRARS